MIENVRFPLTVTEAPFVALLLRHKEIMEIAREAGRVTVEGLAEHFGVTPQTIRRDLGELCDRGMLARVHGGAMLRSGFANLGYEARRGMLADEKERRCLNTAHSTCDGPYQAIASERHSGGILADLMPGPVMWYSMHLICGPPEGTFPTFPHQGQTFAEAWENYRNRQVELEHIRHENKPITTRCTSNGISMTCRTQ